jgi:hypothetical protein
MLDSLHIQLVKSLALFVYFVFSELQKVLILNLVFQPSKLSGSDLRLQSVVYFLLKNLPQSHGFGMYLEFWRVLLTLLHLKQRCF